MADEYITDPELLKQLGTPSGSEYVTDPAILAQLNGPSPVDASTNIAAQAGATVARPGLSAANELTKGGLRDVAKVGSILYNEMTPGVVGEALLHPVKSLQELGSAYIAGHPWTNTTMRQAVGGVGRAAVAGLTAPENLALAPYNLAAYEQEKIRANPTAPEYANNPYAMQLRGQAPTQGAAGEMNRMNALANQQYGGLNAQEQAILAADRQRQRAVAKAELDQLNKQPTASNFLRRMTLTSRIYSDTGQ